MIMPLWIDYIDWKMTTFYETKKSKFNHTIKDVFTYTSLLEVWSNISRMVSALGVAQRTPKECKDKWGNTKKEAKKVYSLARKEQRQLTKNLIQ
jgi:hypothetical protein